MERCVAFTNSRISSTKTSLERSSLNLSIANISLLTDHCLNLSSMMIKLMNKGCSKNEILSILTGEPIESLPDDYQSFAKQVITAGIGEVRNGLCYIKSNLVKVLIAVLNFKSYEFAANEKKFDELLQYLKPDFEVLENFYRHDLRNQITINHPNDEIISKECYYVNSINKNSFTHDIEILSNQTKIYVQYGNKTYALTQPTEFDLNSLTESNVQDFFNELINSNIELKQDLTINECLHLNNMLKIAISQNTQTIIPQLYFLANQEKLLTCDLSSGIPHDIIININDNTVLYPEIKLSYRKRDTNYNLVYNTNVSKDCTNNIGGVKFILQSINNDKANLSIADIKFGISSLRLESCLSRNIFEANYITAENIDDKLKFAISRMNPCDYNATSVDELLKLQQDINAISEHEKFFVNISLSTKNDRCNLLNRLKSSVKSIIVMTNYYKNIDNEQCEKIYQHISFDLRSFEFKSAITKQLLETNFVNRNNIDLILETLKNILMKHEIPFSRKQLLGLQLDIELLSNNAIFFPPQNDNKTYKMKESRRNLLDEISQLINSINDNLDSYNTALVRVDNLLEEINQNEEILQIPAMSDEEMFLVSDILSWYDNNPPIGTNEQSPHTHRKRMVNIFKHRLNEISVLQVEKEKFNFTVKMELKHPLINFMCDVYISNFDSLKEISSSEYDYVALTKQNNLEILKRFLQDYTAHKEKHSVAVNRVIGCLEELTCVIKDETKLQIPEMSDKELFLMADMLKWYEDNPLDSVEQHKRNLMNYRAEMVNNFKTLLYQLYRPNKENEQVVQINHTIRFNRDNVSVLKCLNGGHFDLITQFGRVGHIGNSSNVKFNLVHPMILYMLGTHLGDYYNLLLGDDDTVILTKQNNVRFLNTFITDYLEYMKNKSVIDSILKDIFIIHGETLCIGVSGQCRNMLCL